ncbi:murein transglycosylase [Fusarium albosuccineum]|uniref:Murein transglycosylase n=1 Tax=Fusarium albosuccineum TaxID=1237068 RepID=A0A8H4LC32_9HYPO|nr:murein transglycosylase [Fusarium albosuccineum]
MATGMLRTSGQSIVDADGKPLTILCQTTLGGWMMMENFINGFPGRECQIRAALLKVLGKEKYGFFFDKFLEYFFTEKDGEFLSSLGFNCLRLSFNYHHFEDDMNPFVIKEEGFKHLDRAIEIVMRNPWIAGYNPLNEPADEQWTRLLSFYDRIVPAVRAVDPDHILFLEDNTFSMDFSGFTDVFPNSVYTIHDYCGFGFPNCIGRYQGLKEQDDYIRKMYDRKSAFMKEHNVPVWNGEFGPIYEREEHNPDYKVQNDERFDMLDRQMAIYTADSIAWSIWSYKDINVMGLAYVSPDSPWLKLLGPIIRKKRDLAVDPWAYDDAHLLEGLFAPLHKWFEDNVPAQYNKKYPWQWRMHMHVFRGIRGITMAEYMIPEWADYFKDKSFEELDELAASWKIENCLQRERLNELLSLYAPMKADDPRLEGKVIQPATEAKDETVKAKDSVSGVGVFELAADEKKRLATSAVHEVQRQPVQQGA